jgi:hypothetical protein
MAQPHIVALTQELKQIQAKWLKAPRAEQDLIYSRDFGPLFARLFAELPLDGWNEPRPQFKALISIVGLSWQPVALMSAWVKPEHVLLLGTSESLGMKVGDESLAAIVSRLSGISLERFEAKKVQNTELELGIYKAVMDFVRKYGLRPEDVAVDPTGGKKSMSASAALAGFLAGARLLYVDYAEYHARKRIPVAGTEYPRLLRNPLDVFGELEFKRIKAAFNEGSYEEAGHLADALAGRLYEPREAEGLSLLAKAYGAWHRFGFDESLAQFEKLTSTLDCFGRLGKWDWCEAAFPKVKMQFTVIKKLASLSERICAGELPATLEEGLPLILNHLAAAKRYLKQGRAGATMLLVYATVEKYVDLCLWVLFGVKDEDPDYSKLNLDRKRFHEVGRFIHQKNYIEREPGGPIGLSLGVQLLATLKPDLMPGNFYGRVRGMMNDRNKCEFEHGLCARALSPAIVGKHIRMAEELLEIALKTKSDQHLLDICNYEFPRV